MNTQMKGLLKGLRYISKIFDGKEDEQEMQIGFPTDVKHVAHIGLDGPSVTAPAWMNEFPSSTHSASFTSDGVDPNASTPDSSAGNGSQGHLNREPTESMKGRRRPQHLARDPEADSGPNSGSQEPSDSMKPRRRRQPSNGGLEDSPRRDSNSTGSRHSRRHQSDAPLSIDSPDRDHSDSRRGRRQNKSAGSGEAESDLRAIPKQSRPRKSKGSSGSKDGSTRSKGRSKAPTTLSDTGVEDGIVKSLPTLEPMPERKEEEEEEEERL